MATALYPYLVRYSDFTADTVLMDRESAQRLIVQIADSNTQVILLAEVPNFTLNQARLFEEV